MYVISKAKLFDRVAYAPNTAQREFHKCPSRNIVMAAGRRMGKSTAGGHELLPEVYKAYFHRKQLEEMGRRMEFWAVGPEYSDSEKEFRAFYNAAKRLKLPFDKPGTYYDSRGGDMQVSLWGGKFLFKAQSAKHPEHLVGEGLHGVVMTEAAKMKERVWLQYIRPSLADFQGWAKFLSTPEGRNWFYNLYMKGVAKEDNWASFRFPSWSNRVIFRRGFKDPEVKQMRADMSPELFAQEVEASFSEYVGRVFKDWDEDWHVRRTPYRPEWPVFVATDYGWTNPNVMLFIQVDPFDRVYVLDEYYQTHRSPEEFSSDVLEGVYSSAHPSLIQKARLLYPDPEAPADSYVLSEKLRLSVQGKTGGPLKDRLELIRKWLKNENPHLQFGHPDLRPRMQVDPRCKNLIREMDAYRYPKTKEEQGESPENPLKKDDHCPEALGRFYAGHYGTKSSGGQTVMRNAIMRRRRG